MTEYYKDFRLPYLPSGCEQTNLGDLKGADAQYRCPNNLHVRKYGSELVCHYDRVDPRTDLLGHLLVDAPFQTATVIGVGAAIFAANVGPPGWALGVGVGLAVATLFIAALANTTHQQYAEYSDGL